MNTQEKELNYCNTCNQMTNHSGETCLKHTPDTEKNAYSRGYKQGRFDADMDRLNEEKPTPDTEWESVEVIANEFFRKIQQIDIDVEDGLEHSVARSSLMKLIIGTLSSRDTYWKERYEALREKHTNEAYQLGKTHQIELLRKEVEGMKRKITFNGSDESGFIQYGQVIDSDCEYNQALDTLLDNLK